MFETMMEKANAFWENAEARVIESAKYILETENLDAATLKKITDYSFLADVFSYGEYVATDLEIAEDLVNLLL